MITECQPFSVSKKPRPSAIVEPPTEFGKRLKDLLDARGVSQTKLSDETKVKIQTINGWLTKEMKGGPRLMEVKKVAEYLGVTLDELAGVRPMAKGQDDFARLLSPKEERLLEMYADRNSGFREIVDQIAKKFRSGER